MKNAAVLIPVYKAEIQESELISLKRTLELMSGRPLLLVAPLGLDLSRYFYIYEGFITEFFDVSFFEGIAGYNRLMMSPEFYKRFVNYKYILICQLDVYLFRDELDIWCAKDYDYIGAPWITELPKAAGAKKPIVDFSKRLKGKVGNGGFSLRKVQKHLQIARMMKPFISLFPKNEDFFWSYIMPKFFKFKRPEMKEALSFAFELAPSMAFEMNNNDLPFGVHAWEKYEPEFWQKYIPTDEK